MIASEPLTTVSPCPMISSETASSNLSCPGSAYSQTAAGSPKPGGAGPTSAPRTAAMLRASARSSLSAGSSMSSKP
eukprot:10855135-Heterocapsa_arctica.AAC.1